MRVLKFGVCMAGPRDGQIVRLADGLPDNTDDLLAAMAPGFTLGGGEAEWQHGGWCHACMYATPAGARYMMVMVPFWPKGLRMGPREWFTKIVDDAARGLAELLATHARTAEAAEKEKKP